MNKPFFCGRSSFWQEQVGGAAWQWNAPGFKVKDPRHRRDLKACHRRERAPVDRNLQKNQARIAIFGAARHGLEPLSNPRMVRSS